MRIREVLVGKGFEVVHTLPGSSVGDLVVLLKERNLGAVVVSSDGRHVAGIVSERDVVRHLDEADLLTRPVSTIMTALVCSCVLTDTVAHVMSTMTRRRVRHVPVLDASDVIVGIVSIGDLVKSQISQLQLERDQLQGYISG